MKKVLYMTEGFGLYTKGIKEKSEAVQAMRKEAQHEHDLDPESWGNWYKFSPEDIKDESVKQLWYFQCRRCDTETIGNDNICHECGETCGTNGRRTFAFITNNV